MTSSYVLWLGLVRLISSEVADSISEQRKVKLSRAEKSVCRTEKSRNSVSAQRKETLFRAEKSPFLGLKNRVLNFALPLGPR